MCHLRSKKRNFVLLTILQEQMSYRRMEQLHGFLLKFSTYSWKHKEKPSCSSVRHFLLEAEQHIVFGAAIEAERKL